MHQSLETPLAAAAADPEYLQCISLVFARMLMSKFFGAGERHRAEVAQLQAAQEAETQRAQQALKSAQQVSHLLFVLQNSPTQHLIAFTILHEP